MQVKMKYHFTPLSLEIWDSLDIWNLGKEHPQAVGGMTGAASQEAASDSEWCSWRPCSPTPKHMPESREMLLTLLWQWNRRDKALLFYDIYSCVDPDYGSTIYIYYNIYLSL